jgi:hypothetical protein
MRDRYSSYAAAFLQASAGYLLDRFIVALVPQLHVARDLGEYACRPALPAMRRIGYRL